jgi:hypothetical protein
MSRRFYRNADARQQQQSFLVPNEAADDQVSMMAST